MLHQYLGVTCYPLLCNVQTLLEENKELVISMWYEYFVRQTPQYSTAEQRNNYDIYDDGIHWNGLDEDISIVLTFERRYTSSAREDILLGQSKYIFSEKEV